MNDSFGLGAGVIFMPAYLTMDCTSTKLPYADTGYFSKLVIEYLNDEKALRPFYTHRPQLESITEAIKQKKTF